MKVQSIIPALALAIALFAPGSMAASSNWWTAACDNYTPVTGILGGSTGQTGPNQWTGCIQAPQLVPGPSGSSWDGFKLAWDIVVNPNSTVDYNYRIFGIERGGVSHFILGLSDDCKTNLALVPGGQNACIWNLQTTHNINFDTEYRFGSDSFGPGPGSPGFPATGSIQGVKFDDLSGDPIDFGFSFTSSRLPVWQNFYAKGGAAPGTKGNGKGNGKGSGGDDDMDVDFLHAYNSGLAGGQYFVLAPNGVVPEPGFYGLLSMGVAGLFLAVRRRRKNA